MSNPLTSSAEASPVRTYPSLVTALASKVLAAVSGSSTSDSFASFDPATWSLRTSGRSEAEGSTSSSVALPKAGTMRSGSLFELPTLARLTDASGFSSSLGEAECPSAWATPTARDWKSGQVSEATHERNARPLSEQVARAWATPTRSDGTGGPGWNREGARTWPTATATDASSSSKTNKAGETYGNAHTGTTLFDAVRTFTSGRPDRMTAPRGPTISDDSLDGLPLFEAGGSTPSSSSP